MLKIHKEFPHGQKTNSCNCYIRSVHTVSYRKFCCRCQWQAECVGAEWRVRRRHHADWCTTEERNYQPCISLAERSSAFCHRRCVQWVLQHQATKVVCGAWRELSIHYEYRFSCSVHWSLRERSNGDNHLSLTLKTHIHTHTHTHTQTHTNTKEERSDQPCETLAERRSSECHWQCVRWVLQHQATNEVCGAWRELSIHYDYRFRCSAYWSLRERSNGDNYLSLILKTHIHTHTHTCQTGHLNIDKTFRSLQRLTTIH